MTAATHGGDKVLYTARTHTVGGREGHSKSDDGRLDVKLDRPGGAGNGTNPEQLFAAGWSACFEGALAVAAARRKLKLPAEAAIDTEVDLRDGENGYSLAARMDVSIPGIERDLAQELLEEAHQTCPYSKAVSGNIDVQLRLV
jgi:lipoyl-dependent peroxiredoxin